MRACPARVGRVGGGDLRSAKRRTALLPGDRTPRPPLLLLVQLGDRLFVPAGEPVAAALHGREELLQVDLERVEDLVGVVLGAEADLALARAGVLDDLIGRALGLLGDLLVGDQSGLLLAGLARRSAPPRVWPRRASPGAP